MIHAGHKDQPYVLGCCVRGSHPGSPPYKRISLDRAGGVINSHPVTQHNYVNHLCAWNVRGINGTAKREELVDLFRKGKFEMLGLTETKLKGNGEVSWCGVNGIIAGVQEMERARERVANMINDVWQSAVIDFGYVSSRIL